MGTVNQDFLLRFILDQSSQQKTKAGVDALTGDLGDVDKIVRAATKDFEQLEKQINDTTTSREFDVLEKKLKEVDSQVKDITNSYRTQARVARAEAAAIVDGYEKARVARIRAFGDRLGGVSRTGLAVGGALLGGAFAESNRFAKEAEDTGKATRATREWTAATKELAEARTKVDTVLLRETLPLLKQAAEIASQAADFIEQNPVVIRAALETGKIIAGLSILGILASKGIALYADVKSVLLGSQELAAAKLQDTAANKQLIAARIQAGVGGVPTTGGAAPAAGVGSSVLGAAGLLTGGVAVSALISKSVSDNITKLGVEITKLTKSAPAGATVIATLTTALTPLLPILPGIQSLKANLPQIGEILAKLGLQSKKTADDLNQTLQANTGLAGSAHESEIVSAFEKWKADDARIVQEAADQRVKIVADAEKRVTAETAKFGKQVSTINDKARDREQSLITGFNRENTQSFIDYQEERAKVLKDANQEVQRIEEDHQERLRKMVMEHDDRVEDLTASRDALGLAKEQRRFNREEAEENRGTRLEIARRRQDIADRLQELDAQYQAEKAQRLVQFQQALAENEAQRKEELKQAAAAHADEMKQIREQKQQQLRELAESLNAERIRRREVFIAEVRDLDASLLGERGLKVRYYNLMLADATRFLTDYRTRLAGMAVKGTHDYTGYAYTGMYKMAADGQPEYVLSGAATKAAENIISGGLTQEAMLSALARGAGGGSSRSLTINDQSRFDARISASQVRAIKREMRDEVIKEFTNA